MKNILFATLVDINSLDESGIYQDLMREIAALGHKLYVVSPAEKRYDKPTEFFPEEYGGILKVRIGNIQKTGKIKKGISTLTLESKFVKAVSKYFCDIQFDLVIYSTPPITFAKLVKFIKNRDGAASYLLLKDIFPQNAVDLGLLSRRSFVYRYFKKKERTLYDLSDQIGCLSQANVDYLLKHNTHIDSGKVHVCPNSVSPLPFPFVSDADKNAIREKYNIPAEHKVFVYGGNLGKPQSVAFIVSCLKINRIKDDRYFLICGEGTDARAISKFLKEENPSNVKLLKLLPKAEYDELLLACDVGLIFLDYRFTIPNFPSRLLSYMQCGLPVLVCTDSNTDVGKTVVDGGFGWWCASDNSKYFSQIADEICKLDDEKLEEMGRRGRQYLEDNFLASKAAKTILESFNR